MELDQAGVDRLGDLGGVGGTLDGGTEVLVHERLGDLGQDLEVRGASLSARSESVWPRSGAAGHCGGLHPQPLLRD